MIVRKPAFLCASFPPVGGGTGLAPTLVLRILPALPLTSPSQELPIRSPLLLFIFIRAWASFHHFQNTPLLPESRHSISLSLVVETHLQRVLCTALLVHPVISFYCSFIVSSPPSYLNSLCSQTLVTRHHTEATLLRATKDLAVTVTNPVVVSQFSALTRRRHTQL